MSNLTYKFPEGFLWGSASSGPQSEGAALKDGRKFSIWDHWYEVDPTRFHQQIGPLDTSNFYHEYQADIQLMKETGHNSFRTSIQWSRLIPEGRGAVNTQAVTFYNQVIDELIANDIEPFINLFHFDLPLLMQEIGGWENREVVDAYVTYAKTCFELFGDRVKYFITFNEPIVPVEGGYLYDFHYPNIVDFKRAAQVAHNTIVAHARAVEAYKSMNFDGKIGTVLNLTPFYPRSKDNPGDVKAARIADLFFTRSFLDPMLKGVYPAKLIEILKKYEVMPLDIHREDLDVIKNNRIDFIGLNFYQPRRVKLKEYAPHPDAPFMPEHLFDHYVMPGRKMNVHRGWEIYEKAIYDMAMDIYHHYDNIPFYIAENGMGVEGEEKFRHAAGYIEDDYRIDFIQEHLKWLHKAIEAGANCFGYHVWTFADNWSWTNAYKNRYGLVEVDIHDGFKRTIKKSGRWYKKLSDNNGF